MIVFLALALAGASGVFCYDFLVREALIYLFGLMVLIFLEREQLQPKFVSHPNAPSDDDYDDGADDDDLFLFQSGPPTNPCQMVAAP